MHTIGDGCVTHIVYPHEFFHKLSVDQPVALAHYVGCNTTLTLPFWSGFLETPYGRRLARSHPAVRGKTMAELSYLVPLIVHGDAVPITKKKSAVFAQWGSLIGERESHNVHPTNFRHQIVFGVGGRQRAARDVTIWTVRRGL